MKKLFSTTAIILSLTVGGMSYSAYANDTAEKLGQGGKPHFMEAAVSKLPEKKAAEFREVMKKVHEKNKSSHEQIKKLHEELQVILVAPKFDKSAYLAKSKEIQDAREKSHNDRTEAFATEVEKFSQDERKTLSDSMREMRKKHHHKRENMKVDGENKDVTK